MEVKGRCGKWKECGCGNRYTSQDEYMSEVWVGVAGYGRVGERGVSPWVNEWRCGRVRWVLGVRVKRMMCEWMRATEMRING